MCCRCWELFISLPEKEQYRLPGSLSGIDDRKAGLIKKTPSSQKASFLLVRPARTYSNGCKSLNRPDSGKVTAKDKGVYREVESEGSQRQTSGLTDRNPI